MRAFRRVNESGIGSVIVDSVNDEEAAAAAADGAYTVRTDLSEFGRTHNYRSASGAERIQATVNRFDRYYTHDVVVAVPDDMEELQPFYMQGLMYALASSEVGIATLVSPLKDGELRRLRGGQGFGRLEFRPHRAIRSREAGSARCATSNATPPRSAPTTSTSSCRSMPGGAAPSTAWSTCRRRTASSTRVPTWSARSMPGVRIDVCLVWEDMKVLFRPQEVRGDEIEG